MLNITLDSFLYPEAISMASAEVQRASLAELRQKVTEIERVLVQARNDCVAAVKSDEKLVARSSQWEDALQNKEECVKRIQQKQKWDIKVEDLTLEAIQAHDDEIENELTQFHAWADKASELFKQSCAETEVFAKKFWDERREEQNRLYDLIERYSENAEKIEDMLKLQPTNSRTSFCVRVRSFVSQYLETYS